MTGLYTPAKGSMNIYIYIYIYVFICMYIYRERERYVYTYRSSTPTDGRRLTLQTSPYEGFPLMRDFSL